MKIIDKKGRLFGLINIIDLLFILIVALAIVGGMKKFGNKLPVKEEAREGQVTYFVQNIVQANVDQMKKGDPVYQYDKGTYLGEIEEVKVEPYTDVLDYQGEWINAPVPEKFNVYLTVKTSITENSDNYIAGGEQQRVGTEYRLKTKRNAFFGTCVAIQLADKK